MTNIKILITALLLGIAGYSNLPENKIITESVHRNGRIYETSGGSPVTGNPHFQKENL